MKIFEDCYMICDDCKFTIRLHIDKDSNIMKYDVLNINLNCFNCNSPNTRIEE